MRPFHTLLLVCGLGGFLAGLVGCSQSFWYRHPRVAGRYQAATPYACPPQCPPSTVQTPGPAEGPSIRPPSPCPPIASAPVPRPAPEPCPPVPAIPPSEPGGQSVLPPPAQAGTRSAEEACVFDLVNRIRRNSGRRALAWDEQLYRAAALHSEEQYRHGYMGHGSPDPSRRTLLQRVQSAGYDGRCFGEVVAWGYKSPQAVVEGWMNSRDHRAILMDRDLTEVGFSRVGDYWTGNFGTPRVPRPAPTVRPPSRAPFAPVPAPEPPASAYVAPTPAPAPAPPVRSYFAPRPRPAPQPTYRMPARGG